MPPSTCRGAQRVGLLGLAAALLAGCGTDVDLGGTTDASATDASIEAAPVASADCEPCATTPECKSGALCAEIAGNTFCARACSQGVDCGPDATCKGVTTASGELVEACIPTNGACAPVAGPQSGDAPLDRCGAITGPTVPSVCHACGRFSDDCQLNGCYGGYWCDTTRRDCQRPPKHCP